MFDLLEEGFKMERIKGHEDGRIEVAKNMLIDGENITKVAKYTQLPEKTLCGLQSEISEKSKETLGKYALMRKEYLMQSQPLMFDQLKKDKRLYWHLHVIDGEVRDVIETIVREIAEKKGVTEALKMSCQIEWVQRMNNIKQRAEEFVISELIYQ